MWAKEFDSFVGKFHQLWRAGASAHLDLECHAGQAWVGIQVQLGYPHVQNYHQYDTQQFARAARGPSYQRRQERRRAAAAKAAADDAEKQEEFQKKEVATAKVATDAEKQEECQKKEAATEKLANELSAEKHLDKEAKIADEAMAAFVCDLCDFRSDWKNGLYIHMDRNHANIEQLDGCNDISEDTKYIRSRHYWKSGYLGTAYQSFLDVLDIIEESELSETEKVTEKQKALDSRKNAFGKNYKYYPPMDKN